LRGTHLEGSRKKRGKKKDWRNQGGVGFFGGKIPKKTKLGGPPFFVIKRYDRPVGILGGGKGRAKVIKNLGEKEPPKKKKPKRKSSRVAPPRGVKRKNL